MHLDTYLNYPSHLESTYLTFLFLRYGCLSSVSIARLKRYDLKEPFLLLGLCKNMTAAKLVKITIWNF